MPTLNQFIRHGREEKRRTDRTRASDQCPQGVCPRVSTRTPKNPNSAPRNIAKVQVSNRHDILAQIPGEGHNLQEHSMVLIRGGRTERFARCEIPLYSRSQGFAGIEEIMADYVHQEMTRNFILVYLRLLLLIVMKDLFLALVSFPNKSKNLMDRTHPSMNEKKGFEVTK